MWGPAVCYGPPGKNAKVQEEENRKIIVFACLFYDFLAQIDPRTSGKPVRLFWTGLSLPRPLPTNFTSILHLWFFFKKRFIFEVIVKVFPIFSLFLELRRLWDHSQIVDLIFLIKMVSTRAHETSKTPHSWQNNVPKRSTKYFESISFFLLFLEPWRLWDHSHIVDLIFLIRTVSTRAHETSKTPHSWQNNVPIPTLFPASFLMTGVW